MIPSEPIAITGIAFRFPQGAEDETSFWDMLENGRNVMTEWPKSRTNLDGFYSSEPETKNTLRTRGAHFLNGDPCAFDAPFFSITSKEAVSMDPQQRWMLEMTYQALENAGMPVENVAGTDTAVFVGAMNEDWQKMIYKDLDEAPTNISTGAQPSILANRLSWYFDLRGPSAAVNTACSSSMIATDLACQSLRTGQASMASLILTAIVAASNPMLTPDGSTTLTNMSLLSPDGRSYSFDSRANGYARGEGVAVMVIKRLSDAVRDGDMIRAVIRGSGSNQDGHTPGITQPNQAAQEELIRKVYKSCDLDFKTTRFVEAHGTGTQLGDPTEAKSLGRIFRTSRSPKEPLYVGSVKANIGHLEGVSALASIIKSIMILEKGVIPPNALFKKLNPKINAKLNNIQIPSSCVPWPCAGLRRISINSFGYGGSNGHIILDDALHTMERLGVQALVRTARSALGQAAVQNGTNGTSNGVHYTNGTAKSNGVNGTNGTSHGVNGTNGTPKSNRVNGVHDNNGTTKSNGVNGVNGINGTTNGINGSARNGTHETNGTTSNGAHGDKHEGAVNGSSLNGYGVHENQNGTHDSALQTTNGENKAVPDFSSKPRLLVWSAKDESALKRMLENHAEYCKQRPGQSADYLDAFAYTLSARRSLMSWRSFAVAGGQDSSQTLQLSPSKGVRSSRAHGVAFVFTGQGAQYVEMGLELMAYPVFHDVLTRIDAVFKSLGADWSLFDVIKNTDRINSPDISQPLCTALQVALVELLREFKVVPDAVVGHSSGEIAAAYTLGALSLESACRVAYHRGRLVQQLKMEQVAASKPGAMMSVNIPEAEVDAYLEKLSLGQDISVSCVNSPLNVTLSGDEAAIISLQTHLDQEGIFARKLNTGVAYHSAAMEKISEDYLSSLSSLTPRAPSGDHDNSNILMSSSVTGEKVSAAALSQGQYWVDNLVSPVRFADALKYLAVAAPKVDGLKALTHYFEIGPHAALKRPIADTLDDVTKGKGFHYSSVLSKFDSPIKSTMEMVGDLFAQGYPVSVLAVNQQQHGEKTQPRVFLVDLPAYPFNRSLTYSGETRISRNWRLRQTGPRSLLGVPGLDWNPTQPRWRKFLRVAEMPWLEDHVIGDNCLFPATGSLGMALEAVRQTVSQSNQATITGYQVKEATFMAPIIVRAEANNEVVTQLRPLKQSYENTAVRFEVQLFTVVEDSWTECFKAVIVVEHEEPANDVDAVQEDHEAALALAQDYSQAKETCARPIKKRDFYDRLRESGLKYKNGFAAADDIYWDGGEVSVAHVNVEPPMAPFEGIVSPAVFDAACQVCYVAPTEGLSKQLPTTIPHRIRNAWVSASGWQYPDARQVRVVTTSKMKPQGLGIDCCIKALSDSGKPLCHIERLEMQPIMSNSTGEEEEGSRKLLHHIDWRPQLALMSAGQIQQYCGAVSRDSGAKETDAAPLGGEIDKTLRSLFRQNMGDLLQTPWAEAPAHMEKYVSSMKALLEAAPGETSEVASETLISTLDEMGAGEPSSKMFVEVAKNLASLVRGTTDVSEAVVPLVREFYDHLFSGFNKAQLAAYLHLAAHQTPGLRILEIGAGSGAMTNLTLSVLEQVEEQNGGVAFSEYVYTDASEALLQGAQERFARHAGRMSFKVADLEQDLASQGLQPAAFDMVLVGGSVYAQRGLAGRLAELKKVLKPGGHLIMCQPVAPDDFAISFAFGILPEWWCDSSPATMSEARWNDMLKENGFSGNDVVLTSDADDATVHHHMNIIISTSSTPINEETEAMGAPESARILLVVGEDDEFQKRVAFSLAEEASFVSTGHQIMTVPLTQLADIKVQPMDHVVFLADLGRSLLADVSEPTYNLVKGWMQQSDKVLWVASREASGADRPYAGIKDGFLRTLRAEFTSKRIVGLSLEDSTEKHVAHIAQIFSVAFGPNSSSSSNELEFLVRDGHILTGRLVEDGRLNRELSSSIRPETTVSAWLPGPPLRLDIANRGQLDTLHFREDTVHYKELGPTEVEIEAKAWAVNFRDVLGALGRLPDQPGFGSDSAGIVRRIGSQVTSVKPGDRVCMCVMDCMRMYPRGDEWEVVKIPDSVSFEEACAVINPGVTAWHCLAEVARLSDEDKILIHGASGATGQLAIQIAQTTGAEVFVTVGYDYKKQLLMDEYGIPADHIFYSRSGNSDFAKGVMRMTGGRGVDVVLNSLVGEGLRASWECLAPYGRFVEIGKSDINSNAPLPMGRFANNASFCAVDVRHLMLNKRRWARDLLRKTMEMAGEGVIRYPRPLNVYNVDSVEAAFRFIQSGKNSGRVVIHIDHSSEVRKHLITRRSWQFNSDASYLVVGGLGGIGRSILRWMASRGAKNIIAPSRSGAASEAAIKVIKELKDLGVRVLAPKCNVASSESLSVGLEEWHGSMPPIKGCINAAMALNDSVFDNMSHSQWDRTMHSKVSTSWNLHTLLPNLDIMIFLSSVSGVVGNPGQANYAAGCTFQDALARHRSDLGQRTVSIDLGAMRDVGVIAESKALSKHFEGGERGLGQVEERELLALLDICCDPSTPPPSSSSSSVAAPGSQLIMGVSTPLDFMASSLEPPEIMDRPLFAHFSQSAATQAGASAGGAEADNFALLFRQAETAEQRSDLVARALARKLARALSIEAQDVDLDKALHAYGVDSLVAVELRNWMAKEYAADVAVHEIVGGRTVKGVAELVEKSSQVEKAGQ